MTRPRRTSTVTVTAVAVLALVGLAVPAAPAAPTVPVSPAPAAHVDPVLLKRLAGGPTTALLTWNDEQASRRQVARYLAATGTESHLFDRLSGALVCLGSSDELRAVASAPGAVSVWGDRRLEPALDQSVPTAFNGDPKAVWEGLGVTGKGIGIAVLDTGVDATHPDLRYGIKTRLNVRVVMGQSDLMGPNDPCGPQDIYTDQIEDSEVTSGHGTHIASVAAGDGTASGGRYTGVAPGAELMGLGMSDTVTPDIHSSDPQQTLSLFNVYGGISYILVCGIPPSDDPRCAGNAMTIKSVLAGWVLRGQYDPWHPLDDALEDLYQWGITVVLPVGNDGPQASDCSTPETCRVNFFSASPYVVTAAATPKRSRTALEPYSSRGDPQDRIARGEVIRYQPTLAAPGTGVVAARRPGLAPLVHPPGSPIGAGGDGAVHLDRRYVGLTGTSVAAAHVAGAVALMQEAAFKAKACYLTTQQVLDVLRSTATPMPYQPWEAGAGALDVTAAVNAAASRACQLV